MNRDILQAIFRGYELPLDGEHGPRHWARVLANGRRLAAGTGADLQVVEHFAIFHDCRRQNEAVDHGHGKRGAMFAETLQRRGALDLSGAQFDLLYEACTHHTAGKTKADPTIQACWDADRLDLGRVWIRIDPRKLCTPEARKLVGWADARAKGNHEEAVVQEWLGWAAELA